MSKRTVSSFQMTEADARKFDALEQAGFGSRSDIIRTALDRMHKQEILSMITLTHKCGHKSEIPDNFIAVTGITYETAQRLASAMACPKCLNRSTPSNIPILGEVSLPKSPRQYPRPQAGLKG